MSFKSIFQTALIMFSRSKKKIFYILITIICTILSTGILVFHSNLTKFIDQTINKNIGFRTLVVSPKPEVEDYGKKELLSIEHVKDVYSTKYDHFFGETNLANEQFDGFLKLVYGSNTILPNVIVGRSFNANERNVAICPISFYPSSSFSNMNKDNIINSEEIINTTFIVKYYSYKWKEDRIPIDKEYEKEFKIIGLYSSESVMTQNNECFIPSEDLIEMLDVTLAVEGSNDNETYGHFVIVDNLKNVDYVVSEAERLQFDDISIKNNIDADIIKTINLISTISLIIVVLSVIILTSFYTKKKILNERFSIGVLRVCGYDMKTVKKLYLTEILITSVFSFIIGIIIVYTTLFVLKTFFLSSITLLGINISFDISSLIFSASIMIFLPFLFVLYNITNYSKANIISSFEVE